MKPEIQAAKIETACLEHEETTARFYLVRSLSDERGNIFPAEGVLRWAMAEMELTGTVLARLRARALGYQDMRGISAAGTLASMDRSEFQQRLEHDFQSGHVASRQGR